MKLALAGDTMLGRGVAERLETASPEALFSSEVVEVARSADLFVLNLECCISTRGTPWRAPGKQFFFRAPPNAIDVLRHLGVDCVTLANNHALDYGYDALLDTFDYLDGAGIAWVGAGPDLGRARAHATLEAGEARLAVLGVTDHPAGSAARTDRPGVALADLSRGVPSWLTGAVVAAEADAVLVTPHWGPNMNPEPLRYVRAAAEEIIGHGATLVAGHSAHVFQGVRLPALYDLGDFADDYAVDPVLRNDLGLLWLVDLGGGRAAKVEAVPLKLDYCHTRLATSEDAAWIARRFGSACTELDTRVRESDGRLVIIE